MGMVGHQGIHNIAWLHIPLIQTLADPLSLTVETRLGPLWSPKGKFLLLGSHAQNIPNKR
jgi:hypothetical protein